MIILSFIVVMCEGVVLEITQSYKAMSGSHQRMWLSKGIAEMIMRPLLDLSRGSGSLPYLMLGGTYKVPKAPTAKPQLTQLIKDL